MRASQACQAGISRPAAAELLVAAVHRSRVASASQRCMQAPRSDDRRSSHRPPGQGLPLRPRLALQPGALPAELPMAEALLAEPRAPPLPRPQHRRQQRRRHRQRRLRRQPSARTGWFSRCVRRSEAERRRRRERRGLKPLRLCRAAKPLCIGGAWRRLPLRLMPRFRERRRCDVSGQRPWSGLKWRRRRRRGSLPRRRRPPTLQRRRNDLAGWCTERRQRRGTCHIDRPTLQGAGPPRRSGLGDRNQSQPCRATGAPPGRFRRHGRAVEERGRRHRRPRIASVADLSWQSRRPVSGWSRRARGAQPATVCLRACRAEQESAPASAEPHRRLAVGTATLAPATCQQQLQLLLLLLQVLPSARNRSQGDVVELEFHRHSIAAEPGPRSAADPALPIGRGTMQHQRLLQRPMPAVAVAAVAAPGAVAAAAV